MKHLLTPLILCGALASTNAWAQASAEPVAAPAKAEVCIACHGPAGRSTQPQYPILAGQTARYMYLQLRDYQEGRRKNDLMTPMVAGLSRDDMRALSDYFAQQKPPRPGPASKRHSPSRASSKRRASSTRSTPSSTPTPGASSCC